MAFALKDLRQLRTSSLAWKSHRGICCTARLPLQVLCLLGADFSSCMLQQLHFFFFPSSMSL